MYIKTGITINRGELAQGGSVTQSTFFWRAAVSLVNSWQPAGSFWWAVITAASLSVACLTLLSVLHCSLFYGVICLTVKSVLHCLIL